MILKLELSIIILVGRRARLCEALAVPKLGRIQLGLRARSGVTGMAAAFLVGSGQLIDCVPTLIVEMPAVETGERNGARSDVVTGARLESAPGFHVCAAYLTKPVCKHIKTVLERANEVQTRSVYG